MSTDTFYMNLPLLDNFLEVANPINYKELPQDWSVVVADVRGSTRAIQEGRYKEVNIAGASVIVSILNIAKKLEIPFSFGGDGAALCIPDSMVFQAKKALSAIKTLTKNQYNLDMRVGVIPVRDIKAAGYTILVARYRFSDYFNQAVFMGGGITYAEELLKKPENGKNYNLLTEYYIPKADFKGLECRWRDIPSQHSEVVALLIKATGASFDANAKIYRDVIAVIQRIYGDDEACHPIHIRHLHLTLNPKKLIVESKIRTFGKSWAHRLMYNIWMRIQIVIRSGIMLFGFPVTRVNWATFREDLIRNTDYKKFDDMLRKVMSGNPDQRAMLVKYLDERTAAGELVYGVFASSSALVTCYISENNGNHFHFVDANFGGYAIAAKQLKIQLELQGLRKAS
ncbi:MAG: DUF3095 domain-containing protein [Candidatus Zhuqueibacterota bacterium]